MLEVPQRRRGSEAKRTSLFRDCMSISFMIHCGVEGLTNETAETATCLTNGEIDEGIVEAEVAETTEKGTRHEGMTDPAFAGSHERSRWVPCSFQTYLRDFLIIMYLHRSMSVCNGPGAT